jgi:hypothetical protein
LVEALIRLAKFLKHWQAFREGVNSKKYAAAFSAAVFFLKFSNQ